MRVIIDSWRMLPDIDPSGDVGCVCLDEAAGKRPEEEGNVKKTILTKTTRRGTE